MNLIPLIAGLETDLSYARATLAALKAGHNPDAYEAIKTAVIKVLVA